ncbi:MAG: CDP-alcohol phosphatidyltransferase family protein [Clostridia bacterium]|nr:CDP-alcohol phosphatidyltransferase family protein [Clostridia bacterium]
MIGVYDYTVIATYAALIISIQGIFASISGRPEVGMLCLMMCGMIDTFDGRIARSKKDRTDEGKLFGIQIDSLNDLVCFGVLPAVIGYSLGMTSLLSKLVLSLFALAALIRLAYFNVLEEKRQQETTADRVSYLGLPVTSVSVIMPFFYLLAEYLSINVKIVLSVVLLAMGIAFVAPLRVRKLKLPGIIFAGIVVIAEVSLMIKMVF